MVTADMLNQPYYELKTLISKKGYTQEEIADMIGIPRSTFSLKINRKHGRDFKLSEGIQIASILNANISDFF